LIEGHQNPDTDLDKANPHEIPVPEGLGQEFRKTQETLPNQENASQAGHGQAKNGFSCDKSEKYRK
jgi:hypothetical protein